MARTHVSHSSPRDSSAARRNGNVLPDWRTGHPVPDVVSQIKADGHEVGNHYFKNGPTLTHSDADFVAYLEQTESNRHQCGVEVIRPPGGVAWPINSGLLKRMGTNAFWVVPILMTPFGLPFGT